QYEIAGGGFLATGANDEEVARRFEWVRQRVAFYGSTPAYYPVFAVHGLEDLGHKLNALVREGKWAEMAKEVPDEVAHLFAAVGRHDRIVAAIRERFGGLVDALTLRGDGVGEVPPDLVRDIKRIPHAFRGFAQA
ncbi:MAG: LLM class flavin-dependent oxidoreductase, partial [Stellaceae bacterium]